MKVTGTLAETLAALAAKLDPGEVAALEAAVPASRVEGAPNPQAMMAFLDSENDTPK